MHSALSSISDVRKSGPLVTAEQLVELVGPGLTVAAVRSQIWACERRTLRDGRVIEPNGLAPAIIRVGRKVLVDFSAYIQWLEARRVAPRVDLEAVNGGRHGK